MSFLRPISLSALFVLFLRIPLGLAGEDLIAPTRTLEGREELPGRLTVVSEPPGLKVFLDGAEIGETPVWLNEVKPGSHTLRVQDSKRDVYVEPGKTVTLSYFKGSFIDVPEKKKVAREPAPETEKVTEGRKRVKPREEESQRDLTLWDRFMNGSSPIF